MTATPDTEASRKVLYVEDHPVNAQVMLALFEHRPDLELVWAQNGQEALSVAERLQPALLMLDLGLPDCHGSQLLPRLRQVAGCERTPAVAVTADGRFELGGSGFEELWPKPVNLHWILERLQRYCPVAVPLRVAA